jgi:hypothetical protein
MRPLRTIQQMAIGSAPVALGSFAAVMIVHGGWRAVAAALAILAGMAFLASFIGLAVASERPHPTLPAWASETERLRVVQAGRPAPPPPPAPAAAPRMDHSHGGRAVVV